MDDPEVLSPPKKEEQIPRNPSENKKEEDFNKVFSIQELSQSHPLSREQISQTFQKNHLMTSSSYLSLVQNKLNQNTLSMIDSGIDINSLEHYPKTSNDPFNPSSAVHVLETDFG